MSLVLTKGLPTKPRVETSSPVQTDGGRRAADSPEPAPIRTRDDCRQAHPVDLSFVIPVRNEEATLIKLYERISSERPGDRSFEVIFIDDGSRDRSWDVIRIMTRCEPAKIRGLRLRRNAGNAVALSAGIRVARGGIIFTLDDDLRDGPLEIGRLLDKLDEGYDLVSSRNSGVHRLGPNCGLTCYRAEVAKKWICSQGFSKTSPLQVLG